VKRDAMTREPNHHCPMCGGTGRVFVEPLVGERSNEPVPVPCPQCSGAVWLPRSDGQAVRIEVKGTQASEVKDVLASTLRQLQPVEDDTGIHKHESARTDIAILAALEKELDALLRSTGPWERHQGIGDIRTYWTSTTAAGLSVVAARASGMGQMNAALLARDVMARFNPRKVILVGIAGGLGKDAALGDIVVSDQVVDYELGKVTPTGATPRWSVYRSDALLRERLLDHRDASWLARVRATRPDGDTSARPTIRAGVVLSGNKVIADATAAGALAAVWSRASAIEMEAAGVAAALDQSTDAPGFVMVKAICDRADASKDDSWQEYAAEVAAAFVGSFVFGPLQTSDARARKNEKSLPAVASAVDFRALRLALSAAFDLRELRILVSDLGLDWDNIAGEIKDERIVELLWHLNRRARLHQLIEVVRAERPGLLDAYTPGT
jgi:nucleoside phosphorylase